MENLVSVLFPVYNEAGRLRDNVRRVHESLQGSRHRYEFFVVDDGSTDSTPEVASGLKQELDINYIRYEKGYTRRENLARSFKETNGDIIVFMDIDLAADISYLPALVEAAKRHGIAIGSRYAKGAVTERRLSRLLFSLAYNSFLRLYFGSSVRDHQCGFKAFKREIILELVKDAGYDRSLRRGWFWDAEILIRAQRKGYRIKEIPVRWNEMMKSSFRFGRELGMIPYILRLKSVL